MTAPVRLAIAGLGMVTRLVYLPLLARHRDRFEISALADLSPRALEDTGDSLGVPAPRRHARVEDLVASGHAEALVLATSGSHGQAALAAQEAGMAVLCEKPLAYTLAEADVLKAEPPLLLGYMKLHDPAVLAAARLLERLGPLRSVEVLILHPSPRNQLRHLRLGDPGPLDEGVRHNLDADTRSRRVTALGEEVAEALGALYTDVLLGSLVHDLAVMRRLAGEVASIDHVATWPAGAWPPSVEVSGALDTLARFSLRWHYLPEQPVYSEEVRLHGEHASLALRFPTPYVLHAPTELLVSELDGTGERTWRYTAHDEAFETQLLHFHQVVTTAAAPAAGITEGRRDILAAQQMTRRLAETRGIPIGGEAAGR